jgi:uncharacterized protein (DUF1697 family)
MPIYISMLRGINVAGHKLVKMAALQAAFEALGFEQVRTYIQSGNVVFKAAKSSPVNLSREIEGKILDEFGFEVPVITRTSEEMGGVIRVNPFLKEKGIDLSKLHVTFLSDVPALAAVKAFESLAVKPDQFRASGREIYLYCPNGYGTTKLSNNAFEKVLSLSATTRNWNTVNKLYEMSLEPN